MELLRGVGDLRISCRFSSRASTSWENPGRGTGLALRVRMSVWCWRAARSADIQLHHAHILHDQRIDASVVQLMISVHYLLQLVVVEDGVEGGEHSRVVAADELTSSAISLTSLQARCAARRARPPIYTASAHAGWPHGRWRIAGRAEQFQMVFGQGHVGFFRLSGAARQGARCGRPGVGAWGCLVVARSVRSVLVNPLRYGLIGPVRAVVDAESTAGRWPDAA